jgi:hypothetical protein
MNMEAFSTLSLTLLSFIMTPVFAQPTVWVVFPTEVLNLGAGTTVLPAKMKPVINLFLNIGEETFLNSAQFESYDYSTNNGGGATLQENLNRQLRGGGGNSDNDDNHDAEQRRLQACPPKSWSCTQCDISPLYSLTFCKICGNCRRRLMLDNILASGQTTLGIENVFPWDNKTYTEIAIDATEMPGMAAANGVTLPGGFAATHTGFSIIIMDE